MLTHGHDDHIGDAAKIAKTTGAQTISNFEVCMYLNAQGAENINPGNTGGTIGVQGEPHGGAAFVGNDRQWPIRLSRQSKRPCRQAQGCAQYLHMGDTDIFSDMALIAEIHAPKIGLVPVGDRFTMSGRTAALAVKRFFNFETVVPCHYGTFDLLDQDPGAFVAAMAGHATKVAVLGIGEALVV